MIKKVYVFLCLAIDIDECEEDRCHARAICVNNPGSFVCNCNPGFIGDGVNDCSGI